MQKANPIIMYESPEAASIQTVTGWVSRDGRFFGDDELLARYCGSTHRTCDTNPEHQVFRTNGYCEQCANEKEMSKFAAMPIADWDGEAMLYLVEHDRFYNCATDIQRFCERSELQIKDLKVVLCEPINMDKVESDYWESSFADEVDLDSAIQTALDALNAAIEAHGKAVSWMPGSNRVILGATGS